MVCVSPNGPNIVPISVLVRDTLGNKKETLLQISPSKLIDSIFTDIQKEYSYVPENVELMFHNDKTGEYVSVQMKILFNLFLKKTEFLHIWSSKITLNNE